MHTRVGIFFDRPAHPGFQVLIDPINVKCTFHAGPKQEAGDSALSRAASKQRARVTHFKGCEGWLMPGD
jgi:hypothetical protein